MIRSAPVRHDLQALDGAAEDRLHEATLRVLDEVGIGMATGEVPAVLGPLADHGAVLEADRLRLPPSLVESALERCPEQFLLAARDPALDLRVDGTRGFLSTDGCAAEILDPGAQEPRPSTLEDVGHLTRVADAVDEIAFVWQPVAARDVPAPVASLHELRAQLAATSKHVQMMTAATPLAAAGVVEMARLAAGGDEALRKRPRVSAFQCSVSPLAYEPDALEAALVYARAGVPCGFVVMPIAGASAPITPWGALLQANAEILAGVAILETLVPGAPTFYGACTTVMDLRTGAAACGGPEDLWFQIAAGQLARRYRLPASVGTFASGSPASDWQAGLENGASGLASVLAGAALISGAGLLEGARVFSVEQMLLDAEAFRLVGTLTGQLAADATGAEVPFDDLVELLADVGPGGHYLDRQHTLDHMQDLWQPRLFDRDGRSGSGGRTGPRARARERLDELLAAAAEPRLPADASAGLDEIVREFEERAAPAGSPPGAGASRQSEGGPG